MFDRGKIILTHFPFSDLTTLKRRPALIVSAKINSNSEVIVAFITSVKPVRLEYSDLLIDKTSDDFIISGLKVPSIIKLDKLLTINSGIIKGELGFLTNLSMMKVDIKLKLTLALK
jgi:mRNA interferase MazF